MDHLKKYLGKRAFIEEGYAYLVAECKADLQSDPDLQLIFEDYPSVSRRLCDLDIQDACLVRNTLRARKVSQFLIGNDGKVDIVKLENTAKFLEKNLIPSGHDREDDVPRQRHMLWVLQNLIDRQELRKLIEGVSLPMGGTRILELVKETLRLKHNERVTSIHLRRAILCAALTYLRQNVGSCFATAPAILIQTEQLEQFLIDLRDLAERGSLSRIIRGKEYSVPMTFNWGAGDWEKTFPLSPDSALHLHPGMMIALEESGILKGSSSKSRLREAKKLFGSIHSKARNQTALASPSIIFTQIIGNHFKLTEDEIDEAEFQEKLLWERNSPFDQVSTGKQQKFYQQYKLAIERAKKGFATLTECPLLKCWEYSLASFAEAQDDFAKWNLYTSLGLDSNTPMGIADCVSSRLQGIIDQLNRDLDAFKEEYNQVATHVDYQRARLDRAQTEEDAKWLKIELKRVTGKLQLVESDFRNTERKAHRIANLLPLLLNNYLKLFPNYFQEVYDPDMRDINTHHLFDDSPAGFRLLFKFGRSQTDQWKLIYSAEQYISSLVEFFVLTEQELIRSPDFEGLEDEIGRLVTLIVQHIKTDEFLEGSLRRMGHAHNQGVGKNPLKNLKSLDKKPWSYVSGGSMAHMIQCYYSLEEVPKQREKKVLGEIELLTFYIDTMKTAGANLNQALYQKPDRKVLAFSPTHAFLYKPNFKLFEKAWNAEAYTYTYIRDEYINPRKAICTSWLDRNAIQWVIKELAKYAPAGYLDKWLESFRRVPDNLTALDFRERFMQHSNEREGAILGYSISHLDALLYQSLPFTSSNEIANRLEPIVDGIAKDLQVPTGNIMTHLKSFADKTRYGSVWGSYCLQSLVKFLFSNELKRVYYNVDLHNIVYQHFQLRKRAVLEPMLVADTNWTKYYFAFVVNPCTAQLELWRTNAIGNKGFPMPSWRTYMNGDPRSVWGIYCRPQEYTRD